MNLDILLFGIGAAIAFVMCSLGLWIVIRERHDRHLKWKIGLGIAILGFAGFIVTVWAGVRAMNQSDAQANEIASLKAGFGSVKEAATSASGKIDALEKQDAEIIGTAKQNADETAANAKAVKEVAANLNKPLPLRIRGWLLSLDGRFIDAIKGGKTEFRIPLNSAQVVTFEQLCAEDASQKFIKALPVTQTLMAGYPGGTKYATSFSINRALLDAIDEIERPKFPGPPSPEEVDKQEKK